MTEIILWIVCLIVLVPLAMWAFWHERRFKRAEGKAWRRLKQLCHRTASSSFEVSSKLLSTEMPETVNVDKYIYKLEPQVRVKGTFRDLRIDADEVNPFATQARPSSL